MTSRTTSSWSGWPRNGAALAVALLPTACKDPEPASAASPDPVDAVDAFVGTGGPGFRVGSQTPAATLPFGLVKVGPDTAMSFGAVGALHCSGYNWDDDHIDGFSHVRMVGTGLADYGNVLFMPTDGWAEGETDELDWRQTFSHDDEEARPGSYAVTLSDGIHVELAATRHAAQHRYTFPETVSEPRILIDLQHQLVDGAGGAEVTVDAAAGTVRGWTLDTGSFVGAEGAKVYFHAKFDTDIAAFGTWDDAGGEEGRAEADGIDVGVWIAPVGRTVDVRVGISRVSEDAARANLEAQLPFQDIAGTAAQAEEAWRDALSVVEVDGGTDEERALFYTSLYHALAMPIEHGDADGRYVGFDGATHQADGFVYHSDMSLWDTYRTAHSLYDLLYPAKARDFAISLLRMAEQGGAFPRWPAANGEGGSMLGAPADIVLAETWLKGIRDWDMDAAWPRMRAQAMGEGEYAYNARPDVRSLEAYGYYPSDLFGNSVAWTQELAWADHALALLAGDLGQDADAAHFAWRSYTWKNLWDADKGFFHGRLSDGTFEPELNEILWEEEYTEGNAWQYLWMPFPHADALAETLGGQDVAKERLTFFFDEAEKEGLLAGPQTYYWHGNEPDIHAAFLFALWGDRDASYQWQRWIREELYALAPDGLAGNDDGGTLSSWYVFSALGFYPIAGTPWYVAGVPLFDEARFAVDGGTFTTRRIGDGDHVASVTLNGLPLDRAVFHHDQIVAGGELVVTVE